jgi:hypothetical protein
MQHYSLPYKQQGAVLLIGMIMLVILMLGATSLMNGTVMDERLAGNSKASAEAFFAAEAGYLNAVRYLEPADKDDPAEIEKTKNRWKGLEEEIDFTHEEWEGSQHKPELPKEFKDELKKDINSKHSFNVSIAPVFEPELDVNGDIVFKPNGQPKMNRVEHKIQFVSTGTYGTGERVASRSIGFDLDGGGLFNSSGIPPAPAAISCFGGACTVEAGAANDAPISGQDHDFPEENCKANSQKNPCWISPEDSSKAVVPAVYLSEFTSSSVELQGGAGGAKKVAFIGLDKTNADLENNDTVASGKDKNSGAVWGDHHYPNDENNESTAPKNSDYVGPDLALMQTVSNATQNADSSLGTITDPKASKINPSVDSFNMNGSTAGGVLVVEGTDENGEPGSISHTGTGAFVGLIIIRDCNQVNFGGNFSVYGAIIVDATDCPSDYKPFFGNGTPDVKYSQKALGSEGPVSDALGLGNGEGVIDDWYEIVNND